MLPTAMVTRLVSEVIPNLLLVRGSFRHDATLFPQYEAWIAMQFLGCRVWRGLSRWKRYGKGLGRLRYSAFGPDSLCLQCTPMGRRRTKRENLEVSLVDNGSA